jgi:CDP-diacylglycerol--serine O-phosphatidyltransferase
MGAIFSVMTFLQEADAVHLLYATGLIPLALLFDVLDGRIARWRRAHSAMGRELDSLADIISFGVAPASIAYGCGMQGFWDRLILLYFVGCGVSRLARFNVTAETLAEGSETGKVKYFEGTPIPTSILLVGLLAYAAYNGAIGEQLYGGMIHLGPWKWHPLSILFFISGSFMISTIKIPKI